MFDKDQYAGDVTKETDYSYFPKTFLDLLCNLRCSFPVFNVFLSHRL